MYLHNVFVFLTLFQLFLNVSLNRFCVEGDFVSDFETGIKKLLHHKSIHSCLFNSIRPGCIVYK